MELIFVRIDKYRNFGDIDINLSNKFDITFSLETQEMEINELNDTNIYPEHITNINAIVGKNGVGKTNLLDMIGMRKGDRNKHNSEFENVYKDSGSEGEFRFLRREDFIRTDKNAVYFLVYYMGTDFDNRDLFAIEGNDIESYKGLFTNYDQLMERTDYPQDFYWKEKYWFPFICHYENRKFEILHDTNARLGEYKIDANMHIIGDYKSEQDKLAIILLREKFNTKYYDINSFKPEDESKIMIPRRIGEFQPGFLSHKIRLLYDFLRLKNGDIFLDEKYRIGIKYYDYLQYRVRYAFRLKYTYESYHKDHKKKELLKLIESFVMYNFDSIYKGDKEGKKQCVEKIDSLAINSHSYEGIQEYYTSVFKIIISDGIEDIEYREYFLDQYGKFINALDKVEILEIKDNTIQVEITSEANIDNTIEFIEVTIDERAIAKKNDTPTMFSNFFEYYIWDLSDGEMAYLDLFTSIYEQVMALANKKEKYILLLDEPEIRMHPELSRNFVDVLIKFLGSFKGDSSYQIIIATHSPFILSDIPSGNIILLEKDDYGQATLSKHAIDTFGANIHSILKNNFFMKSTIGEFAKNTINRMVKDLNDESKVDIDKDKAKYLVSIIGEKLIKDKLDRMYKDRFPEDIDLLGKGNQVLIDRIAQLESLINTNKTVDRRRLLKAEREIEIALESIKQLLGKSDNEDD